MTLHKDQIYNITKYKEKKLGSLRRIGFCLNGIEDLLDLLEGNGDLPNVSTLTQVLKSTHQQLSDAFVEEEGL